MAFNERLLILHSDGFLGYCSKLDSSSIIPFTSADKIPPIKAQIPLENIKSLELIDKLLIITFIELSGEKKWSLKMSSPALGFNWENRIM